MFLFLLAVIGFTITGVAIVSVIGRVTGVAIVIVAITILVG